MAEGKVVILWSLGLVGCKQIPIEKHCHCLQCVAQAAHRREQKAFLEAEFCNLLQGNPNNMARQAHMIGIEDLLQAMDDELVEGSILGVKNGGSG